MAYNRTMLIAVLSVSLLTAPPEPSYAWGTAGCGKLSGGVPLPCRGENFTANTRWTCALGRNFVHPRVQAIVMAAYQRVHEAHPNRMWQYGETGFEEGGQFWPHKTHQNGLSVDFFFPALEADEPTLLPMDPASAYGYAINFAVDGKLTRGALSPIKIDWQAMADHLDALEIEARAAGGSIRRIILSPQLRARLIREVPAAGRLKPLFNRAPAWVLHDEHYHVDFDLPSPQRRAYRCESKGKPRRPPEE